MDKSEEWRCDESLSHRQSARNPSLSIDSFRHQLKTLLFDS